MELFETTILDVEIKRDGYVWRQRYEDSKPAHPLRKGEPTRKTGTTLTFWADPGIFETTTYNAETVARRLQEMAFLNKGLSITLRDERVNDAEAEAGKPREVVYRYEGGISDFVRHINSRKGEPTHAEVIDFEGEDKDKKLAAEIALQWNSQYSESIYAFDGAGGDAGGDRSAEDAVLAAISTLKWVMTPGCSINDSTPPSDSPSSRLLRRATTPIPVSCIA